MDSNDQLFDFFSTQFPFNKEGLIEFINSFETVYYKKGDILLSNNQVENQLRFLDEGIVREFYFKEDKDVNIGFYTEPEFISDFTSLIKTIPTKKSQECISDIKLRILSKHKFENFLEKYSCGKTFVQGIFQKIISDKEQEQYNYLTLSPDDLYCHLLMNKSTWIQKIPQYHLASYLQITPETLSRIRKRIS